LTWQTAAAQAFTYTPLISIITPVYNPGPHGLREMIGSVLAQTYANWEICLVDGVSDRPGVKETLREFQSMDGRIHLRELEQNLGISGNSNAALEMAGGEFIALLDHDDTLSPHALFEVVKRLNEDPQCDLLYSDHDLLSQDGSRRDRPLFKPGWSPEIMLSANYLTHLTVIRAARVREAGSFDPRMDGAQDWELFMRVSEKTQKIAHIPKILYHWREAGGSTASDIWSKPYAPPAQLRVIGEHLNRQGLPEARAFFDASGYIRVHWALEQKRKVSIIIPSNGANELLETCIGSILDGTAYPNYEIVVVNNGPRRPEEFDYYRRIETDPRVRVLHYAAGDGETFNYNSVNNFGARAASGDLLLFLNNDTRVIAPDWLDELVLWAEREEIGVVGAKLLHPDGTIQHAGVVIGLSGFAGHIFAGQPENQWTIFGLAEWYRNYSAVTGACMMVRREVYDKIGGLDEAFLLCGSDVEICLRVQRAGLRVVVNPFARLIHLEGATRSGEIPAQDFRISYRHYLPALQSGDPFFNPNLSYWQATPTLRGQDEQQPLQFVLDFLKADRNVRAKQKNEPLRS
jgi:GT2 family glycosyltransferase